VKITRFKFLLQLVIAPLAFLGLKSGLSEYQKGNKLYFKRGKHTFVIWPDGDEPLTDKERKRAHEMAKEYFGK